MQLTFLDSFEYYDPDRYFGDNEESSDLAKKAIGWFMLGCGFTLPSNAYLSRDRNGNTFYDRDEAREAFRELFVEQVKDLIQRKPRLEEDEDGDFTIYYLPMKFIMPPIVVSASGNIPIRHNERSASFLP